MNAIFIIEAHGVMSLTESDDHSDGIFIIEVHDVDEQVKRI